MCPVDLTSLFVPNVLAVETDTIAFLYPGDSRCEVDVVRNKYCLTRCEPNDEPLMPAAIKVIRQDARYFSFAFNLDIARPIFKCTPYCAVIGCNLVVVGWLGRATANPGQCD